MSILLYRYVMRESKRGPTIPEKKPLSKFWKIMPHFVVKWMAKRNCAQRQIGHLVFVEAFTGTYISIGRANEV